MSIIGKLLKTTIDVVTLPISVTADIVTWGGALTDRTSTYTGDHLKCVGKDLVNVYEDIEKL